MNNLRICMITSEFPPQSSGIGYAAFHSAKALINKGNIVTVITRGTWFISKTREIDGIKVYELPFIPFFPPFHIIYHRYFINKLLKKIGKDFDLINFHSPLVPALDINLPKLVTVHSTWYYESKSYKKIVDWYSLAVHVFKYFFIKEEQKLFSTADELVAISETKYLELGKYYNIDSSKISVIPNSINLQNFKISSSKPTTRFLFIGRLVYAKGLLDLIEAAKSVIDIYPHVMFTIIGRGPLEKTLRKKINELHLENNVELVGVVKNCEISNYFSDSVALVLPSYYEGLPIVVLEAMACGKPVIASDLPSLKEVIHNNQNGLLFKTGDVSELTSSILALVTNQSLWLQLGKQAFLDIKKYDVDFTVSQLLSKYIKLITKYDHIKK